MSEQRRNDVGSKILIGVVAILVTTILSITIGTASKADSKANNLDVRISKVEVSQEFMQRDLKEIKDNVKEIRDAVVK